jgi:hypothetical protein
MILRMCLICKRGRSTQARLNYHPRYRGHGFICGDCATDAAQRSATAHAVRLSPKHAGQLQHGKS